MTTGKVPPEGASGVLPEGTSEVPPEGASKAPSGRKRWLDSGTWAGIFAFMISIPAAFLTFSAVTPILYAIGRPGYWADAGAFLSWFSVSFPWFWSAHCLRGSAS